MYEYVRVGGVMDVELGVRAYVRTYGRIGMVLGQEGGEGREGGRVGEGRVWSGMAGGMAGTGMAGEWHGIYTLIKTIAITITIGLLRYVRHHRIVTITIGLLRKPSGCYENHRVLTYVCTYVQ